MVFSKGFLSQYWGLMERWTCKYTLLQCEVLCIHIIDAICTAGKRFVIACRPFRLFSYIHNSKQKRHGPLVSSKLRSKKQQGIRSKTMAMGFYKHHSGLWCILYTPVSYIILFFVQSQKTFWQSKISTNLFYMKSFRQIGLKFWKKRSDSKSISDRES